MTVSPTSAPIRAELSTPLADTATLRLSAIAAALADAEHNRASAGVFSSIPSGWRNLASGYQVKTYRDDADTEHRVEYRFTRTGLALPGDPVVQLVSADVDQVVLAQDGVAHGFTASHPEDAEVRRPLDRAIGDGGQTHSQHGAGVARVDHPVVVKHPGQHQR